MLLPVSPKPLENFAVEFGSLECNVEIVDSLQDAVQVRIVVKLVRVLANLRLFWNKRNTRTVFLRKCLREPKINVVKI